MKNVRVESKVLRPDGGEQVVHSVVVQSGVFTYEFYCRSKESAYILEEVLRDDVAAMVWTTLDPV